MLVFCFLEGINCFFIRLRCLGMRCVNYLYEDILEDGVGVGWFKLFVFVFF